MKNYNEAIYAVEYYRYMYGQLIDLSEIAGIYLILVMTLLGEKIKELREQNRLLQREVAAKLEIDTPMLSKIERGDRSAKREHVVLLYNV